MSEDFQRFINNVGSMVDYFVRNAQFPTEAPMPTEISEKNVRDVLKRYESDVMNDVLTVVKEVDDTIWDETDGQRVLGYFKVDVMFSGKVLRGGNVMAIITFKTAPSINQLSNKESRARVLKDTQMIVNKAIAKYSRKWSKAISKLLSGKLGSDAGPIKIGIMSGEPAGTWFFIEQQ